MGASVGTGVTVGMTVGLGVGAVVGLGLGVDVGAGGGVGSGIAEATGASVGCGSGVLPTDLSAASETATDVSLAASSSGMAVGSIIASGSGVAVRSAMIIGVDLGMMSGSACIMASGVGCIIPAGIAVGVAADSSIKSLGSGSDAAGESAACSPSPLPPPNNPVTLPATITVKATTAKAVETRIAHSNTGLSGGGVGAATAAGAILNERGASTSGIRRSIWTVALSDSISSVHESQPCRCASSAIRSASNNSPSTWSDSISRKRPCPRLNIFFSISNTISGPAPVPGGQHARPVSKEVPDPGPAPTQARFHSTHGYAHDHRGLLVPEALHVD